MFEKNLLYQRTVSIMSNNSFWNFRGGAVPPFCLSKAKMQIEQKILSIIEASSMAQEYEVVQVKYFNMGRNNILQILVERKDENPIRVEDCEKVSHTISALLDVEDVIKSRYNLEVSSAGIDRPLVRVKDYIKYVGYEISVSLLRPIASKNRLQGKLLGANDQNINLATSEEELVIDYDNIDSAKLVLTKELLQQNQKR